MRIELVLDKSLPEIVGNPKGVKTFKEQVEKKVDWNGMNTIVFPSFIEDISVSFVQGFCSEIFKKIKKEDLLKHFEFQCEKKEIVDKILDSIFIVW